MILTLAQVGGVWQDTGLPVFKSTITLVDIISLVVLPILLPWAVGKITNSNWPVFNKRVLLLVASLATTVLTDIVQHAASGTPYDIGWGFLHFIAAYALSEGVYKGFLKAPLEVPPTADPVTVDVQGVALEKLTKAELIDLVNQPPAQIEVTTSPAPKTLASIIQKK